MWPMGGVWNWVATVIAVAAAAAAIWQAFEARSARRGAEAAEGKSVAAAERMATAMEEQAALARAEADKYVSPWVPQYARFKSNARLDLLVRDDCFLSDIEWVVDPPHALNSMTLEPEQMRGGDRISWLLTSDFATGPSATLDVSWRSIDEAERRTQRFTVSL